MKKILYLIVCATLALSGFTEMLASDNPGDSEIIILDNLAKSKKIKVDTLTVSKSDVDELVIVGKDTVSIIIPQNNYGRYDRGLFNFLIIPKGSWMFGLTASFGEFNTQDMQLLSIIEDLDFKVKAYSLSPTISYFYKNNQSIGLKFRYEKMEADLGKLAVNFDDDIDFSISDVSYYSQSYSAAVNYRYYVGLGKEKRFAVFNEVDLLFGAGSARFKRYYNNELRDTQGFTTKGALNFSPGLCVFLMDNACFNVSFGVFGVHLTHERQKTNGERSGSRTYSGANFRFNIFNINFGLGIVI